MSVDRSELRTAALLLAKAESTNSDDEAAALALRSYRLLASFLNAYEDSKGEANGAARKRERRLLKDRRSARATDPAPARTTTSTQDRDGRGPAEYSKVASSDRKTNRIDYSL
jgi:hypothetical protein